MRFSGRIDDVVNSLHAEVERHKLADWPQPSHGRAHSDTREACFGDRGVNNATASPFLEQTAGALVRALVPDAHVRSVRRNGVKR